MSEQTTISPWVSTGVAAVWVHTPVLNVDPVTNKSANVLSRNKNNDSPSADFMTWLLDDEACHGLDKDDSV